MLAAEPASPWLAGLRCDISSARVDNNAGAIPATSAVTSTTPMENTNTAASILTDSARGRPSGTSATSASRLHQAIANPVTPAMTADQHAFRQHLTDDSRAAGTQRGAQRKLSASRFHAHQEKVGDVRAGDQQHQPDGTEQGKQRSADIRHEDVRERTNDRYEASNRVRGCVSIQPLAQSDDLARGLFDGHPGRSLAMRFTSRRAASPNGPPVGTEFVVLHTSTPVG